MKDVLAIKKFDAVKFFAAIFVSYLAGIIGSIPTMDAIDAWYKNLNKPFFNPPNWIFAPVWTTLYFMMGVAFYLVLVSQKNKKDRSAATNVFLFQLLLNAVWSILFFGLQLPLIAFFEIVFLWFMISVTIRKFVKISIPAAVLMIPYFLWVTFAMILNAAIVLLN